jgi:hypothetical protein
MADAVGGSSMDANSDANECHGDGNAVGEDEIEAVVVVYVACWEAFYRDGLVG